jgi:hypothetical protein
MWPPPTGECAPGRSNSRALTPASCLAAAGATLLLTASVIVVASRWQTIPQSARFSGLVAALVATAAAAEAGRKRFPTTSTAIAVLAATLTAPAGIAAAATIEQSWPTCIVVGGLLAFLATEAQARRWKVPVLRAASVVAIVLAATGVSALGGLPVPVLVAIASVVAIMLGADRRGLALAVAAASGPVFGTLAPLDIGPGTLQRIGVAGGATAWSAPLTGLLAACVIGLIAHRLHNIVLTAVALTALLTGVVAGHASSEIADTWWWMLLPIFVLLTETVAASATSSIWKAVGVRLGPAATAPLVVVGLVGPLVAYGVLFFDMIERRADAPLVMLMVLVAGALCAHALGTARRIGEQWYEALTWLAAAGAGVVVAVVGGAPMWGVGAMAVLLGAAAAVVSPRSTRELPAFVSAMWGLTAVLGASVRFDGSPADPTLIVNAAVVIGAGALALWAIRSVQRDDLGARLAVIASMTSLSLSVVVGATNLDFVAITSAIITIVGIVIGVRRPVIAAAVLGVFGYALTVGDARPSWWAAVASALIATALAIVDRSPRSPWPHLAAVVAATSVALAGAASGLSLDGRLLVLVAVAVSLTGLAFGLRPARKHDSAPGWSSLDTAAVATGALAVLTSSTAGAVVVSIIWIAVSAQGLLFGVRDQRQALALASLPPFVAAIVSLWWTTGTNNLVIDAIRPYGASGADVALAVVTTTLLAAGGRLRRAQLVSSWLAYGAGLAAGTAWLLTSQLEVGADWATIAGLVTGVGAMAIGAVRRLGAPLVAGCALTTGTLLVSAGPRLSTAPTWAWIATGGTGLLVLAALLERNDRPIISTDRSDPTAELSILASFCRTFR